MTSFPNDHERQPPGRQDDCRACAIDRDDPRVIAALEQYLSLVESGRPPDRSAFLDEHAEIASLLGPCIDGLNLVQGVARCLDAAEPAPDGDRDDAAEPVIPLGDFHLLREIGRGGMGVVYEATQMSLGRRVALKVLPFAAVLDKRNLSRFKSEARAAATLHHHHIVPVFSVGCDRGVHYYAMQYIEGYTLAELIRQLDGDRSATEAQEKPSGVRADAETRTAATLATQWSSGSPEYFQSVARVGVQVAEALHYAHQEGIVHRDVKPSNILIDERGHAWITDFGLAQVQGDKHLTMTGNLLGTLRYMSPEQAAGNKLMDDRTDVYSLGVTLYEMATHRAPFIADNRQELLRQVADERPRRPRQRNRLIPTDLETIILKAMAKEPESRYQTANDLAEDLQRFVERKPIRARPARRADHLWRWARRHPMAAMLLTIIAVLVSILAIGGPIVAVNYSRLAARERVLAVKYSRLAARETDARNVADESRRKLQKVLDRTISRTAGALKSMGPLQQRLSEDAVSYYDGLLQQRGNEPEIRFEVAVAYTRLGWVYYLSGQDPKALELYRTGLDLLSGLTSRFPAEQRYRFELADAHAFLGDCGAREEAPMHYNRAIELARSAVAASPEEPTYWGLGYFQVHCARYWQSRGRLSQAEQLLDQSVSTWRSAVEQFEGRDEELTGLTYSLYNSARLQLSRCRYGMCRRYMDEALTIVAGLGDHLHRSPETAGGLTACYGVYGRLLCCLHRPQEAELYFRRAISTANDCLDDFPHFRVGRENLADAYAALSVALVSLGREQEGQETLRACIDQWQQLVDTDIDSPDGGPQLSWAQFRLGRLLWRSGRQSDARELFRNAFRGLERLVAKQPKSRGANRYMAFFLTTCPDPTLRGPQRAVRCAEAALLSESPGSWQVLGWACCHAGQWERGLHAMETCNQLSQGGDAFNWLLLAMIHYQLGRQQEADRWYQRAVDATENEEPVHFSDIVWPLDIRDVRDEVDKLRTAKETTVRFPLSPLGRGRGEGTINAPVFSFAVLSRLPTH